MWIDVVLNDKFDPRQRDVDVVEDDDDAALRNHYTCWSRTTTQVAREPLKMCTIITGCINI